MKQASTTLRLRLICAATLVALGLMVWSLFDPRPLPVIVAMSVAQGVGTVAFLSFLFVVMSEIR